MYRFLFLILFLCGVSCARVEDERLLMAKESMKDSPGKSLLILNSISDKSDLDKQGKALYNLLYVQALDKNILPIKSDSLIYIALDYYKEQGNSVELAQVYYYLGCYFVEYFMTQEAIQAFLQAEKIANPLNEWDLLGLIYGRLECEYGKQQDWKNAFKMNWLAISCFQKSGDIKNESLSYLGRGIEFMYTTQIDSCRYYNRKARQGFEALCDELNYANTLVIESNLCLYEEELDEAKLLINRAKLLYGDSIDLQVFLTSAIIYKQENKLDSAYWILSEFMDRYPDQKEPGVYFVLAEIEQERKNYNTAFNTLKHGYALQDSLYKNNIKDYAYRYSQLYDKNQMEIEKQKLNVRNRFLLGGLLFSLLTLFLLYYIYKKRLNCRSREVAESRLHILETEKQIGKLQEIIDKIDNENRIGFQAFFSRQIQMLKELAEANAHHVHNEKKRNESIRLIREKYLFGEDWDALKMGINVLHNGVVDYIENHYGECLSGNEIKICVLTCGEFSIQEIAAYLKLSEKTVYNSRSRICKILSPAYPMSLERILNSIKI